MHHPWRELRNAAHLRLRFVDLGDDGPLGKTDGNTIILTTGLLQVERRCVLAHELVHIERGIPHGTDPRKESAVEQEVAHRLVPLEQLLDSLRWSDNIDEVAEGCWVMPHLIRIRLEHLHPSESAAVAEVLHQHHAA